MLDHVPAEGQDLEGLEALEVSDVADHVGREGELFAVEQQMEGAVHFFDRRVDPDQFYFTVQIKKSRWTGTLWPIL